MSTKPKVIHGDDLIYRFLRDLFTDDEELYGAVPRALLAATGIWFPPEVYSCTPVLAPFVVRDPTCRGTKTKPDEWGSPDASGFMRDDNSMIKALPRSLAIVAPSQKHLNGRRMATEFVAAHVWRECSDGGPLASRRPLTNSFVPNLVWLPKQVAKLTDLEGGLVQRTLQQMSWARYRHVPVEPHLQDLVDEAWSLLPDPGKSEHDFTTWNYFVPTEAFLANRGKRIETVLNGVEAILNSSVPTNKIISTRYGEGLQKLDQPTLAALEKHLLDSFPSPRCRRYPKSHSGGARLWSCTGPAVLGEIEIVRQVVRRAPRTDLVLVALALIERKIGRGLDQRRKPDPDHWAGLSLKRARGGS